MKRSVAAVEIEIPTFCLTLNDHCKKKRRRVQFAGKNCVRWFSEKKRAGLETPVSEYEEHFEDEIEPLLLEDKSSKEFREAMCTKIAKEMQNIDDSSMDKQTKQSVVYLKAWVVFNYPMHFMHNWRENLPCINFPSSESFEKNELNPLSSYMLKRHIKNVLAPELESGEIKAFVAIPCILKTCTDEWMFSFNVVTY